MKRLGILLLSIIVIYSIYYDFKEGTLLLLPAVADTANTQKELDVQSTNTVPSNEDTEELGKEIDKTFVEVTIQPGDTVLSLVEKERNAPIPVSIEQVVKDFEQLNDGTAPTKVQIGKEYKIPVYPNKTE